MKMKFFRAFLSVSLAAVSAASLFAQDSFITFDHQTGHILNSKNPNDRRQVASLTKIALGVVTLDAAELKLVSMSELAQVPQAALSMGGMNPAGLQTGDLLTLRDLLYCSLMASDNIAAYSLAHHVGKKLANPTRLDPVGNFVSHMNALARNLQMKKTLFLNPHGIDNIEGTIPYSTAADIGRLTRYAYSDADFRFFVSQKSRSVEVSRNGSQISVNIENTNQLVGQDGIDGVKTGMTAKAGYCLVLSSWKNPEVVRHNDGVVQTPRRIVTVILGADTNESRFSIGLQMIRQGWSLYDQWAAGGRQVSKSNSL